MKLTLAKINLTVASMKHYGQACAIARALDVVGDRWSLLLVRELTLGPRPYTDPFTGPPRTAPGRQFGGTLGRRNPLQPPDRPDDRDRRSPAQHRRRRHRDRPPRPGAPRRSILQARPRHLRRQAGISPRHPSNKSTCHLETSKHQGETLMSETRSTTIRAGAPGGATAGGPRLGLALLVLATAQLMVVLDATIVNVALPHIQQSLGFSGSGLEWVVNAYALAFGGLLLLGGRAGDLLGRRKMFIAGLLLFSAASLAAGFPTNQAFLLPARPVQSAA